MNTWIALLRGINVGGNNILPMKDLRDLLEGLGLENVKTYIQSGNIVFRSQECSSSMLAERIADRIKDQFGFRPTIMVISKEDLSRAILDNPFVKYENKPKCIHFSFLQNQAKDADLEALRAVQKDTEQYLLTEKVFYLYAPEGIGRSKLAAQAEKKLGVPATARNLRTVLKLKELAGAI